MKLTSVFTTNGAPALSKSPVISGWTTAGSLVISGEAMTEIDGGFYFYDFTGYDHLEDYVFVAYEVTLSQGEQYSYLTNDIDSQRNQGVIKQILGLVQGNMRITGQTYDSSGNLLTATIISYPTAADATAETSATHSYDVVASYDGSGNLTSYKSIEA